MLLPVGEGPSFFSFSFSPFDFFSSASFSPPLLFLLWFAGIVCSRSMNIYTSWLGFVEPWIIRVPDEGRRKDREF